MGNIRTKGGFHAPDVIPSLSSCDQLVRSARYHHRQVDGVSDSRSIPIHEDLPGYPARKSGEEWQPVAKRRKEPSWFTNAPPGRAGLFTLGWHGNLTTRYVFQLEDTGVHEFRRTYSIQPHEFIGPPAWGIFTFRTPNGTETKIYVSPRRLWWNSEHIAYRFGEPMEDDPRLEGGAIYQGWLGTHIAC